MAAEPMGDAERRDLLRLVEQRKAELLEKRKYLESIGAKATTTSLETPAVPSATSLIENVLEAIQKAQAAALSADEAGSPDADRSGITRTETKVQTPTGTKTTPTKSSGGTAIDSATRYSRALKKLVGPLATKTGAVHISVAPRTIDKFDRSCQCDVVVGTEEEKSPAARLPAGASTTQAEATTVKVTPEAVKGLKPDIQMDDLGDRGPTARVARSKPSGALSEEDLRKLLAAPAFEAFFQKASRQVERALGESELFDVFADYSHVKDRITENASVGEQLRKLEVYSDHRWSSKRPVMEVRTHPTFKDLFLAAYAEKESGSCLDYDGAALVWNLAMPSSPQSIFTCQSQVCSALFDTYRPYHIIGGTYTGAIVVWDTRAKTRPVQRTPLSSKSHLHPVYAMELVGTEHANNLVTVDLDGRLCLWSLAMLGQATETIDLKRHGKETSCLCLSFPEGENNSFIGGAEDGSLDRVQIHGSNEGIVESFPGHTAPVTAVHWHPHERSGVDTTVDCSDLLLSSSCDWSIKLWSPKSEPHPLHSFDVGEDYATDVEWHPINPGVFGATQADGKLRIWDLSRDIEMPAVVQSAGQEALTCLKWSSDGYRVMTGSCDGTVTVWGASSELATCPRQEGMSRLAAVVEEMRSSGLRPQIDV